MKTGRHIHLHAGALASGLYYGRAAREERAHRAHNEREIIDLLELQDIRHKIVGTLPYGLQKRVELARALALDPTLLLLDEPTAGMSRAEAARAVDLIRSISTGRTLVIVEHDMGVVFDLADRISVLVYGEIIATDVPARIRENAAVQAAYLGTSFHA